MATVADPEKQLAWEATQRPRAAIAALTGGVLLLGSLIWSTLVFGDVPTASRLTSIANALKPGPIGQQPSLRTPQFQYYEDHAISFIGSSVIGFVGFLAFAWALTFLAAATRARRPEMTKLVVYLAPSGPTLGAVGAICGAVGLVVSAGQFLDGPRTVDAARDASSETLLVLGQLLTYYIAPLLIAASLVLICLNAMRVGLLTRFLGILGIIVGAMAVLAPPLFSLAATFWLVSIGMLMVGAARGGAPPAWRTGQAEPWPSQREIAEARRAARTPAPEPVPEAAPTVGTRPHSASKKRKRKRRG